MTRAELWAQFYCTAIIALSCRQKDEPVVSGDAARVADKMMQDFQERYEHTAEGKDEYWYPKDSAKIAK